MEGTEAPAVNYPGLTGSVQPGDEVLLNVTAVELGLGTGGVHFVICNLSGPSGEAERPPGHIVKLRYTPLQAAVLSVEEDDSPHQERIREFESLDGMPVICCELHSQIAPAAAALKVLTDCRARIAYVMTDGATLPIAFSRLVAELKAKGLVDAAITCGQAFGGDIEAINVYTALIAAKQVVGADAAIVCQGPGNAGTGSPYGFSGTQQGEAINACNVLGGRAVAVVRMSFADLRERHRGASHHTQTVLGAVAVSPALVALPELPEDKARMVNQQLEAVLAKGGHQVRIVDGEPGLAELARKDVRVTTMGRSIEEDREFFLAASAGGALAAELIRQRM
ncbi:MAG TPA: DUF3866 family protein [Armatimonadota bacterium]|nr:DUF3866 family protein [Armatimonadota bacterium]